MPRHSGPKRLTVDRLLTGRGFRSIMRMVKGATYSTGADRAYSSPPPNGGLRFSVAFHLFYLSLTSPS
jgi:hypothetical protein